MLVSPLVGLLAADLMISLALGWPLMFVLTGVGALFAYPIVLVAGVAASRRSRQRASAFIHACAGVALASLAFAAALFSIGGPQFHGSKAIPYAAFALLAGFVGGLVHWAIVARLGESGPNPSFKRTPGGAA
jgi:hypothetical protein